MILSEFTGAAQSLNGSLIVNPWNTEDMANAIHDAVTMSAEQREANFRKLERYVFKYTSAWWGQSFVAELTRISSGEHTEEAKGADKKEKLSLRGVGDSISKAAQDVKDAVVGKPDEEKKE
jgi:trehalose 6-phosphate synthase